MENASLLHEFRCQSIFFNRMVALNQVVLIERCKRQSMLRAFFKNPKCCRELFIHASSSPTLCFDDLQRMRFSFCNPSNKCSFLTFLPLFHLFNASRKLCPWYATFHSDFDSCDIESTNLNLEIPKTFCICIPSPQDRSHHPPPGFIIFFKDQLHASL